MPETTADGELIIMRAWKDCISLNARQFNASFIYLHRRCISLCKPLVKLMCRAAVCPLGQE